MIGYAVGNAMNRSDSSGVRNHQPRARPAILFPSSSVQWKSLTDMTDAELLARHLVWASTSDAGKNQAFNVVN